MAAAIDSSYDICSICNKIIDPEDYDDEDKASTDCHHCFHLKCLMSSLMKNNECPKCHMKEPILIDYLLKCDKRSRIFKSRNPKPIKNDELLNKIKELLPEVKRITFRGCLDDDEVNAKSFKIICGKLIYFEYHILDDDYSDFLALKFKLMKYTKDSSSHVYFEKYRENMGKKYELIKECILTLPTYIDRDGNNLTETPRKVWIIDENAERYVLQQEILWCLGLHALCGRRTNEYRYIYVGKDGSVGYYSEECEVLMKNVVEEKPEYIYPNAKMEIKDDKFLLKVNY